MSSEVAGLAFLSLSSGRSSTPSPEQPGICCFKMPESKCQRMLVGEALAPCSQKESIVGEKSGVCERFRRHSVDGSLGKQDFSLPESSHYHPYRRQYSEGSIPEVEPFSCVTTAEGVEEQSPWTPLCTNRETSSFMGSQQPYDELETESEEASGYTTFNHQTYNSPLQQQLFSSRGINNVSHYFNQSLSSQTSPDSSAQTLYPKPVYSYSILIFLALRNSKTGSLPVSEIYSFMTEHFPYFKTAPDGWKNSVRHNLSLNKCFEKIENKNGSSSRKGCLWALNPAKVEKMQEELHKWRRKDPLTVRRSMARPEELERLLGERPEKVKSFGAHFSLSSSHNHSQSSRIGLHPIYGQQSVQDTSVQHQKPLFNCLPSQNVLQPPPYSDPSAFSYYSPISQLPCTGHPSSPGPACLDSPLPAHTPPNYSSTLQAGHGTAGSIQLLMEGEISNDIDALNPSLTDLQLNGNLWEALRNDSLTPDSLVVLEMPPAPPPQLGLGVYSLSAGEMETDDGVQGSMSEMYLTGPRTHMFSNVDNLASLLSSSGNTPIPLL